MVGPASDFNIWGASKSPYLCQVSRPNPKSPNPGSNTNPGARKPREDQSGCSLKVPAQAGVDLVDGVVAPPHLGVVVDQGRQSLAGEHVDVAAHHGKIPPRLVGGEGQGAATLAQAGVQPPAVVGKFMLIEGGKKVRLIVPLLHH